MNSIISVLMPIYKGEKHLKEAIDSILNQTFTNFEFVIVNDASPDNSEEIILSYDDPRIIYKKHKYNKGLVSALNSGLAICKGKYIARMDQDDISDVKRLQLQYDFMENNPDYILLGGQADIINSKYRLENPTTDKSIRAQLILNTAFVHPTVMLRKSMLDIYNLKYSEKYKHAEDYGFWIDLAEHGKIANLSQTCLYYRRHEEQYTVVFNHDMRKMGNEIRKKYLRNSKVDLSNVDLELLETITERRIKYHDEDNVILLGDFLSRLPNYFVNSSIENIEVKKLAYRIWNRICDERMKAGLPTYKIYISSSLAFYKFNLKIHLFYLKKNVFKLIGFSLY